MYFFLKSPNFERFEKFYYFSCNLRQICYILWKKIDIRTREQPMLARLRELNWQTSGKTNAVIWEEDFAFHIFNTAQTNKSSEINFIFIRIF